MNTLFSIFFVTFDAGAFGAASPQYNFKIAAAPGQTIGGYTLASPLGDPTINNAGEVVFSGYAKVPNFNATYLAGLFSLDRLAVSTVNISPTCLGPYIVNDFGKIAFVADSKIGPNLSFVSGVYESDGSGGNNQIVAPGAVVGGVQLVGNICGSSNVFSFNNTGRIAFVQTGGPYTYTPANGLRKIDITKVDGYTVTATGLVDGRSEDLLFLGNTASFQGVFTPHRLLAKTGEYISGIELTGIFPAVASTLGQFALIGSYGPPSAGTYAIFTKDSVIAKTGDKISGRVISTFFGHLAINDWGEVAFTALVSSGTFPTDLVICARHSEIIAVGDSISGHAISSLGPPALNDFGVIAFHASFTDGSDGIVLATPR
jgi:hypothetical protein